LIADFESAQPSKDMTTKVLGYRVLSLIFASALPAVAQLHLNYTGQVALPGGGEIIAYTADNSTLATTYFTGSGAGSTQGVNLYNFAGGATTFRATADLSSVFGQAGTFSVTSVALDPLGRGFGVATVVPTANTTELSKLAFFNYNTGAVINTVQVGYHADSVSFAKDGSGLVVANEGEANAGTSAANDGSDARGSISYISLAGITNAAQAAGIGSAVTTDFSAGNLSAGASLSGVRNPYIAAVGNPGNSAGQQTFISQVPNFSVPTNIDHTGIEPEYAVIHGGKIYVSLQENNAIGVYDVATGKWEKIQSLGTIQQTIDATDTGAAASVSQSVRGLPMPDTISLVTIGGVDYIVTANEGDARIDDRDLTRFGDVAGGDSLNPILDPSLPTTATGERANAALGRLNISRIDGDTDGDGDIDVPVMFGTRSFSIWNAATGQLVSDSGSLEAQLLALDPTRHNINRENVSLDNRSDDKGPEPEALTVFNYGSEYFAAIGLERQNGIMLYNITDPTAPSFVSYVNGLNNGLVSPESLLFISAADNPTGTAYLLAGFEGVDGTGANAGIGIYSVSSAVPEPSTYALFGVLTLGALAIWRRRK
jgi:hypothetical protein